MSEKGDGRDHNPTGFTMWMAGGGVKGGQVIGETDELGLHASQRQGTCPRFPRHILGLLGSITRKSYTCTKAPGTGRSQRRSFQKTGTGKRLG